MTHESCRVGQAELLDRLTTILRSDERVLGIVLAGSCARGENDAFSDIDVGCYLRGEALPGREELFHRVAELAPLLCSLWIYDRHALYLFENGLRLDLDFLPLSELPKASHAYSDARILHDPEGLLARSLPERGDMRAAEHPKWFEPGDPTFLDWFFWMFRQVVCWSKRAAQGGERAYTKMSNAVDSLAEVRTRLAEMRLWTLGSRDYLGRADPLCARSLAATFPHLDPPEILSCALRLLDEYERIGPEYCLKAGAEFPGRKARVVRELIAEFDRLV